MINYSPINWQPAQLITANNLNKMEEGIQEAISSINNLNTTITPMLLTSTFTDGSYIRYSDGKITNAAESFSYSDYVDITGIETIKYSRIITTSSAPLHGIAFYDANKVYISGQASVNNGASLSSRIEEIEVPENAKYLRMTWLSSSRVGENTLALYDVAQYDNAMSLQITNLSETTSELVDKTSSILQINVEINAIWTQGTITDSGVENSSNYYCRTNLLNTFDLPEIFEYSGTRYYKEIPVTCTVCEYNSNESNSTFLRKKRIAYAGELTLYHRSPDCTHIKFILGIPSSYGVYFRPSAVAEIFYLAEATQDALFDSFINKANWKVANALARARQMSSFNFIAAAAMPNQGGDYVQGHFYRGVPYSSARALDTFVGLNVSMHTFASLVKNPRSVIYTRYSTNTNSKTYVGVVCSAFVDFCYGIGLPYTTSTMRNSSEFIEHDIWNIAAGDVLVNATHTVLVTNVEQDKYGRVYEIGIAQASVPYVNYKIYTLQQFKDFLSTGNYKIYSYVGMSDEEYIPCQYVKGYPDESLNLVYPDIMSEYGDKSAIVAGTNVTINVLDTTGYNSIKVYKNNVEQTAYEPQTLTDFTISNIPYGTWKVELVGDNKTSSSEFIVVDVQCTIDSQNVVTFSSANATPFSINSYEVIKNGNIITSSGGLREYVRLTTEDINRGTYDVSAMITDINFGIRIAFKTAYGQVAWRSIPLELWAPYN